MYSSKTLWKMHSTKILHYLILHITIFGCINAKLLKLPQCDKYAGKFTVFHKGYKLENTVTLTLHIAEITMCLFSCMKHLKCQSISISKDQGICLLHYNKNKENNAVLVEADGWTFVETDGEEDTVCKTNLLSKRLIGNALGV